MDRDQWYTDLSRENDDAVDGETGWMSSNGFMNEEDIKVFRKLCVQETSQTEHVKGTLTWTQTSTALKSDVREEKNLDKIATFITKVDEFDNKESTSKGTFEGRRRRQQQQHRQQKLYTHHSSSDYLKQHFSKSIATGKQFALLLPRQMRYPAAVLPPLYAPSIEFDGYYDHIEDGSAHMDRLDHFDMEGNEKLVAKIKENRSNRPQFVNTQFVRNPPKEPGKLIHT